MLSFNCYGMLASGSQVLGVAENSGILENWFAKGCHLFLNSIEKMNIAIKPFPRYFRTHYSIIPIFQHSLRCAGQTDWRPTGTKLLVRVFKSSMIP